MTAGRLAIDGGRPVRERLLPYGRQSVDDDDIAAVVSVLRSDWLTTGPKVEGFEQAVCAATGASHAVAVANGTAALHAAMHAVQLQPGDEVIVPAMTFAATANAVLYEGATPVFADIDPQTLLLDVSSAEAAVGPRTRAIVTVDYAGLPSAYDDLRALTERDGLALVSDACHALGATDHGRPVGSLADLSTFSFHPVKPVTTAEGGAITTDDPTLDRRMQVFRNHGITTEPRQREERGSWFYEMVDLGFNYRLSDLQCALGESQLRKLEAWTARRREIAARYRSALAEVPEVRLQATRPDAQHAYHIVVALLALERLRVSRLEVYAALRAEGIGVNVHYIPVHLHPYYRERFGTAPGLCPAAEDAYTRMLTLPAFPAMSDGDVDDVVTALRKVVDHYRKDA